MRTVPVSTEEAQELVSTLTNGLVPDQEGRFTLVVTEGELTSYMSLSMSESIIDPQILLADGQIYLYGTIVSPVEAPVSAVATIEVDRGEAHIAIQSVSVDGFPIPQTFMEAFAEQLDGFISATQNQENVEITSVEIEEGAIVISGQVLP
jgi:multidrug efflux pump subunit AcrA (membrane-fusion protein)